LSTKCLNLRKLTWNTKNGELEKEIHFGDVESTREDTTPAGNDEPILPKL